MKCNTCGAEKVPLVWMGNPKGYLCHPCKEKELGETSSMKYCHIALDMMDRFPQLTKHQAPLKRRYKEPEHQKKVF